jgi:hypothetical protein
MKQLFYFLGLLVTSVCLANVIRVPEDYATIQVAVNASVDGDSVLVNMDIINENIVINKNILLVSLSYINGDLTDLPIFGEFPSGTKIVIQEADNVSIYGFNFANSNDWAIRCNLYPIGNINLDQINVSDCVNGIDINAGDYINKGNVRISNTTILNTTQGWGLEISNGRGIIQSTDIKQCPSSLYVNSCQDLLITNSSFSLSGNLTNDVVRFLGSTGEFDRTTFYKMRLGNSPPWFFVAGSNLSIKNSIIWDFNSATSLFSAWGGYFGPNNQSPCCTISLDYCCTERGFTGSTTLGDCVNLIYNTSNITGGLVQNFPRFVNDWNNLHILATSPCIDTGDPSSPLDPDGTRADIGAYYFCQGEGIALPAILRTSTEPGYPEPITVTLHSSCDPVAIDSARTETGLFTLDSYPSQVAGEFQSGDFQLTFQPSVQGLFTDTLHIWADTDPPHQKIPLVGESGPIPAPVTDLSISILPDLSAWLSWTPVTQTIYGNPVTPDYYLIFYNELDPQVEEEWYYLTPVVAPGYTHQLVARFRDLMNYRVVAWKGIDPALMGWEKGMKMQSHEGTSRN